MEIQLILADSIRGEASETLYMGRTQARTIFVNTAVPKETRYVHKNQLRFQRQNTWQALQLNDLRQLGWQILKVILLEIFLEYSWKYFQKKYSWKYSWQILKVGFHICPSLLYY